MHYITLSPAEYMALYIFLLLALITVGVKMTHIGKER